MEVSDIDCECAFEYEEQDAGAETDVLMSAVDTVESVVTPQLVVSITEADDSLMEVLSPATAEARSRRRQKKKQKKIEPRLNVSREKSPFGEFF
jgi:hypothetical protein